jgi:hypothetical protein
VTARGRPRTARTAPASLRDLGPRHIPLFFLYSPGGGAHRMCGYYAALARFS